MKRWHAVLAGAWLCLSLLAMAQSVPPALSMDPPADSVHPAHSVVLHIPSHGVLINGLLYAPAGAGLHPTLVLCHGLPGNEKNLDLAQAVRRAGWNVVTFNYRGSWGSPGTFRFVQNIEDADAVLAYLRSPAVSARLSIDTHRMVLAGHSMGGWVTVNTAAHDHALAGAILISAADMSAEAARGREETTKVMADNMEALNGVTAASMADDLIAHGAPYRFSAATDGLAHTRLLVLSANDGLAPQSDALVAALRAHGNRDVTAIHADTDHVWSDHRIYLETQVLEWLGKLQ